MPLLSSDSGRPAAPRHDERGFTMVTVIISMLVVMLVSVAALSAAQGDLPPGKHDADRRIAYAAAEAGVQNYLFHLIDDVNYWSKCTTVSAPVNDPWDGTSTRRWASVPGSRARYTVELLPANGNARCLTSSPDATMIDSDAGTFRVRVTGQALTADGLGGVKRTIVVNFKRQGLLDFIYFTDKESLDPSLHAITSGGYPTDRDTSAAVEDVTQWGTSACNRYYGDDPDKGNRAGQSFYGAGGSGQTGLKYNGSWRPYSATCREITFASGDAVRGPLHTNDEISCQGASPVAKFGRTPADRIEIASSGETAAAPPGYRGCTPYVNFGTSTSKADAGTWKGKGEGAGKLDLPPSNSSLKRDTAAAYRFVGETKVVMNGSSMTVSGTREDGTSLNNTTVPLPADGVLYVANSPSQPCTTYNPIKTSPSPAGCGNLEISGTYGVNVTFTAENDILIKGDITRASGTEALLGLISNNFIRVDHPTSTPVFTPQYSGSTIVGASARCTNNGGPGSNLRIDAAILSLTHSFTVDNYYCGAGLGTLNVNGAIAQAYRGPVGTSGGTGYIKNYTYDNRLKYRSPPHFLNPLKAGWVAQTYNEQVPAR